ncbi:uncharacterized protein BO96DRAFT_432040 [Aspergillus niger CBS 101883]|uniref:uncharacterized protein n=1 Tax=Aspergillus lacticoffeatus (strain CBS 101883) TaxID=1450533 RepID=UPI000D7EFDFE|nr:uncharacterized protein BO96DRAFT_432040 [Aspergillus niger CBS 101883]PYH58944.1 hypothetical protein BO96DRAFT_432040 [Aspergillus niger CBS 101883]
MKRFRIMQGRLSNIPVMGSHPTNDVNHLAAESGLRTPSPPSSLRFGLYLRRGPPMLASKHQAEAHSLRMIEQSTIIPASGAHIIREDLKRYVAELRAIPFKPDSEFRSGISLGEECEELRRAAKLHDRPHVIYYTHGDLIPRNTSVENGRISGIADWENAGWFPECWEYTKAHYSVRYVMRWLVNNVNRNMLSDLFGPF